MKNNYLQKFQQLFTELNEVIESGDYELAFNELTLLCQEYEPLLGEKHMEIVCAKLTLAQICMKLEKADHAQELFDSSIEQIRIQCENNSQLKIDAQMMYGNYIISLHNYEKAINIFEQIINDFGDISKLTDTLLFIYYTVIDLLDSLYSQIGEHQRSADMSMILIDKLLEDHTKKNGELITQDNMSFDEITRDQLISKYLGLGASLSRLGKHIEARKYLEKGYFISITYYGDKDERTLKLNYNLASNEMLGIDYQEGLRQLRYVYKDMIEYLGENNKYTLKAKEVLSEFEKDK